MYINEEKKPYPFCPGCSHVQVIEAINRALQKVEADPRRTVMVSDIGCVGLVDSFFNIHTFHGLHGRSFTYAAGIKLANSDLNVFVMVGDGGCGIGGHHLINAARRNIGIKVIAFNNFNFGMTGGQHSVTSFFGSKTRTTPGGHLERGFDLAKLVEAAGSPFVARKLAFDKDLDETIALAMRSEGFAFLDVWEVCTAYYMPMNDFKKPAMEAEIEKLGMKLGVLREERLPEYSCTLRAGRKGSEGETPVTRPIVIAKKFEHRLPQEPFRLILAGSAGMKIVSSAGYLGNAALKCGLHVSQKDDFPITVQSGHSVSEMILSSEEVEYLGVDKPDAVIILSEEGLAKVRKVLPVMEKNSLVIAREGLSLETPAKVVTIDPKRFSNKSLITAALQSLIRLVPLVPQEAFFEVIGEIKNEAIRNENLKAMEIARSWL